MARVLLITQAAHNEESHDTPRRGRRCFSHARSTSDSADSCFLPPSAAPQNTPLGNGQDACLPHYRSYSSWSCSWTYERSVSYAGSNAALMELTGIPLRCRRGSQAATSCAPLHTASTRVVVVAEGLILRAEAIAAVLSKLPPFSPQRGPVGVTGSVSLSLGQQAPVATTVSAEQAEQTKK